MINFKWITPGELAQGQWVTILGLRPVTKEIIIPTGDRIEITEEDKNPFIKGTPFQILDVKLPLVMLHNVTMAPNIPPVVFYDTRLVEFLEIDQDYAVIFARHMYPPKQMIPTQIMELPVPPEENQDPQQTFDFGSGEDGDETGGPPLVPA